MQTTFIATLYSRQSVSPKGFALVQSATYPECNSRTGPQFLRMRSGGLV